MLTDDDEHPSWIARIKQWLQHAPNSINELISWLHTPHIRAFVNTQTLTMVENVLQLGDLKVRDIMLPHHHMTAIQENDTFEDVLNVVTQSGHSRFPVYESHKNRIIGILHAKDLLRFQSDDAQLFKISDIMRKAMIVSESNRLDHLLAEFRNTQNHMAIVVDEYGNISGIITLENIVEQIIGDIDDEFDIDDETALKFHEPNRWILKAHTSIETFNHTLNTDFSDTQYHTVGGILLSHLGRLPKRHEQISLHGFLFTILQADTRGIKLLECLDERDRIVTSHQDT